MPWNLLPNGVKLFSESLTEAQWPLVSGYSPLSASDLVAFYANALIVHERVADEIFAVPGSLAAELKPGGKLGEQPIEFALIGGEFRTDSAIEPFVLPIREEAERRKFELELDNRVVLRVCGVRGAAEILVQRAKYFDGLATNFYMDHRPAGRSQSLREYLQSPGKTLAPLHGSKLSNHLGVVCMVETADGMLLGTQRGKGVAKRAETLSASASGTVDFTNDVEHLKGNRFGVITVALAAMRELREELGADGGTVRFLGMFREFLRGGHPDMYFYARTPLSAAAVRERWLTASHRHEVSDLKPLEFLSDLVGPDSLSRLAFERRVKRILEENAAAADLTFVTGTLLSMRLVLMSARTTDQIGSHISAPTVSLHAG
jgi:8-oxo-dGTP pyrophosphatase MutT (NUDIX family)